MSSEFACPLGCSPHWLSVAKYVSFWETCNHYDFVVIKVVAQFSHGEEYCIQ
jgi:hypothetical protein